MFSSNASQVSDSTVYVEDVFSTWLYTGTGAAQTITNNIDLSTKGGLVWFKRRDGAATNHYITDTARGLNGNGYANSLASNSTAAQSTSATVGLNAFNSNGFSIAGTGTGSNANGTTYASWTFREQPKFFDVVTYTGTGGSQTINHNLGSTPGCIIVKCTSNTEAWYVYHRSLNDNSGDPYSLVLNTTAAQDTGGGYWGTPTSTQFTVKYPNAAGQTYVAYLFAHDAGGFGLTGTDNVISCGSFTTNGTTAGYDISLGYEPQYLMVKRTDAVGSWLMLDTMRGFDNNGQNYLFANLSNAESASYPDTTRYPTATGFHFGGLGAETGSTYIYIAIRRGPMKVPTDGTKVFNTFTGGDFNPITTGFPVDAFLDMYRPSSLAAGKIMASRLTGSQYLITSSTNAEATNGNPILWDSNTTVAPQYLGYSGTVVESFRRAPSFFDEVCYTGNATARTINHNLGVVPELMIVKRRTNNDGLNVGYWVTYAASQGNTKFLYLNTTDAVATNTLFWDSTSPTSTVFTVGTQIRVNGSGEDYVAYLFASCPGVSKVGSYTGNGSSQTINCGFTGGARFVMIKPANASGGWIVFDSARGIVSGNDPYLYLNNTNEENYFGAKDVIDADSSGFVVNSALGGINDSGDTFIYLAIA